MNISEVLDMMDDLLDDAWSVPLSGGKCVVDAEKLRDLIGELRLNMPNEIKQAKLIVADRNLIVEDAKKEAEMIINRAKEKAQTLVSQDEITKEANKKANEIMASANAQARDVRTATSEFADNLLHELEESLLKNIQDVKSTRAVVRKSR